MVLLVGDHDASTTNDDGVPSIAVGDYFSSNNGITISTVLGVWRSPSTGCGTLRKLIHS